MQVAADLRPVVSKGLLVEFASAFDRQFTVGGVPSAQRSYRWLHDRIQQATYELIAAADLPDLHLRIGRALLKETSGSQFSERLFEIATHFNRGATLITDEDEKIWVAELNLAAGNKAKASCAYASAVSYLAAGIDLLGSEAWESRYELVYPLHLALAECETRSGNPDRAARLLAQLLERARTKLDKAQPMGLKLEVHWARGELAEAVQDELAGLALCGIELPLHPTEEDVVAARNRVRRLLGNRPIEAIVDLPLMTDPEKQVALQGLQASYFTDSNLYFLRAASMVALSLEHGNCDDSAFWYSGYSLALAGRFGDYQDAHRFALVAYTLMEQRHLLGHKARIHFILAGLSFWTEPVDDVVAQFKVAFQAGMEVGDLATAGFSGCLILHEHARSGRSACGDLRNVGVSPRVRPENPRPRSVGQFDLSAAVDQELAGTNQGLCNIR